MPNKIYKKRNKLIIEIPLKTKRNNVYNEDLDEEMYNIVGMIEDNKCGFCYAIDRSYKGKDDDYTDFFYEYMGEEKDFIKLCYKLGIPLCHFAEWMPCDTKQPI